MRPQAEPSRLAAGECLLRIVDNIPGALFELAVAADGGLRYAFLSEGFRDFGVPPEAAMRDFEESLALVHPDDRPGLVKDMREAIAYRVPFKLQYRVCLPDGRTLWLGSRALPGEAADGGLLYYGWIIDITERRGLEAQLAEARNAADVANRAKSAFLAAMSHEIRTPMVGITGMLEVLSNSSLNAQQRRQIKVIEESAEMLLKIVGDVLDFSRIEAGRMEIAPAACSLGGLVQAAVQNFMPAASSKGLRLSCAVDGRLAPAHVADALRVRQILSNFLSNALKFTAEGGVSVRVDLVEGLGDRQRVRIAVGDTGIGIGAEVQAQLFKPFAQADAGVLRRHGGAGLGLAICRNLARLMGGSVDMDSAPGRGTTIAFTAVFPVGDPAAVEPPAPEPVQRRLSVRRKPTRRAAEAEGSLLLLAEDHSTNRMVLARQIELAGFVMDVAEDGQQAFEMFSARRYGLVFTDVHMPRMDGFRLAAAIRDLERRRGRAPVPVLGLTAAMMKEEVVHCLEAGMNDVLIKPVTVRTLVDKLRLWLPRLSWTGPFAERRSGEERRKRRASRVDNERRGGNDRRGAKKRRAAAPPPAAPLDLGALRSLSGGDAALEADVLRDFDRSAQDDMGAIRESLEAGDLPALARRAHRLRGAALTVGAGALAEAALRLERAGKAANRRAARAAVPKLERAHRAAMAAVG
ncbi:MAG: response regulator, partial [Gammaproteobacteria bacterium]|nr:response regulator [Gammaproteobacteria bacterium]